MSEEETQSPSADSQGESEQTTNEGATTSYLDGKYESVSALENGYKELQSVFSKKTAEYKDGLGAFTGAPEKYELPDGVEVSDAILNYAKENNFSNEALSGLMETYNGDIQAQRDAFAAQQREELGSDADARLSNVQDWAKANLGDDAMETFGGMVTTAKSVELVEKIMKMQNGTAPAPSNPKPTVDRDSIRDMRFAMDQYGNRKMSSDVNYRAKVEAAEAEFVANGGKL